MLSNEDLTLATLIPSSRASSSTEFPGVKRSSTSLSCVDSPNGHDWRKIEPAVSPSERAADERTRASAVACTCRGTAATGFTAACGDGGNTKPQEPTNSPASNKGVGNTCTRVEFRCVDDKRISYGSSRPRRLSACCSEKT